MAPRSPSSSGSRVSMPAALLAMQRKVPTRLIWISQVELVDGEMLDLAGLAVAAGGLGGVAGARAVDQDPLLAVGGAGLGEGGVDVFVGGDVALAEDAADFLGYDFAFGVVHVEDRDLHAVRRQRPRGRLAEAGGAAGDDSGD